MISLDYKRGYLANAIGGTLTFQNSSLNVSSVSSPTGTSDAVILNSGLMTLAALEAQADFIL